MENKQFNFDNSYSKLPNTLFTKINPEPVSQPKLVIFNKQLAIELNINLSNSNEVDLANIFSGNVIPENACPISQAYAGHQFGHFTIRGDGRAKPLGEHIKSKNNKRFDIQLKGSGKTPYSRNGDGRAALGPMLREYLISEALHHLRVPTTRGLAVVTTGEKVLRESQLRGSILTRIASSHIRIGTFQYVALKKDVKLLKILFKYTIKRHFPSLIDSKNLVLNFLKSYMNKQIDLIVNWMRVGFIHGVMNTDNVTLSGETIDYGPCAFLDQYSGNTVFSSIDYHARYSFNNQPIIAQWNFARFTETLLPLIDTNIEKSIAIATELVESFAEKYKTKWLSMMKLKLGLLNNEKTDETLILELLNIMERYSADYTNTFRELSIKKMSFKSKDFKIWFEKWNKRLKRNNKPFSNSKSVMEFNNPVIIPRNFIVESVLDQANNYNMEPFNSFLSNLSNPYEISGKNKNYLSSPVTKQKYETFCGT